MRSCRARALSLTLECWKRQRPCGCHRYLKQQEQVPGRDLRDEAVRRVFVDTSAFFAHLVAEDAHHPGARALFERADREAWTLITTNTVVWETYTLIRIRARNGRELALGFLEDIQDGLCDIGCACAALTKCASVGSAAVALIARLFSSGRLSRAEHRSNSKRESRTVVLWRDREQGVRSCGASFLRSRSRNAARYA